jgi:hypothetical protein
MEKERILKVKWSKRENDFLVYYPRRCDGALIQQKLFTEQMLFDFDKYKDAIRMPYKMEENFINEVERRGYDKTTLKFEIRLKSDVVV